ncbi:PREDICTED: protein kintoun-like [Priapulus caudatus]|uniref:Protein kintoun n=1 Tax=Priapulus caudatus TaxID=37621 RepID=A0ABM1EIG2_PRICU|nr:PREDICTED: protein kintoun-like [Priapulus caudatus]
MENLKDLEMTSEEISRFKDAFKHKEFLDMFSEYAKEIADPENRRKREEEIALMEKERGIDTKFITPDPSYVLQTNAANGRAIYINICRSEHVEKSACKSSVKGATKGLSWSIPYASSPQAKDDYDDDGKLCTIIDVIFNHNTLELAERSDRFKELVEGTAFDAVKKVCGESIVHNKNVRRPTCSYKGARTSVVIRNPTESQKLGTTQEVEVKDDPIGFPNPYALSEQNGGSAKETLDKSCADKDMTSPSMSDTKYATPKYNIIHRCSVDLQDFVGQNDATHKTQPNELVVAVYLPLLNSASTLELDVFPKSLSLQCDTPAKYKLTVNLPYTVLEDEGTAKFDVAEHKLVVILPVRQVSELISPVTAGTEGLGDHNPDHDFQTKTPFPNSDADVNTITTTGELVGRGETMTVPNVPDDEIERIPTSRNLADQSERVATANQLDRESSAISDQATEERQSELEHAVRTPAKIITGQVFRSLPAYRCQQTVSSIVIIADVKNVEPCSVVLEIKGDKANITFKSVGSGFVPFHYILTLKCMEGDCFSRTGSSSDVSSGNVVCVLQKAAACQGLWSKLLIGKKEELEVVELVTEESLHSRMGKLIRLRQSSGETSPCIDSVSSGHGCSLAQEPNNSSTTDEEGYDKSSDDTASQEGEEDGWTVVKKGNKRNQSQIPDSGSVVVVVDSNSDVITVVNNAHNAEEAIKSELETVYDDTRAQTAAAAATTARKQGRRRHSSDSDLLVRREDAARSLSDTESLSLEVVCSRGATLRGILKKRGGGGSVCRSVSECSVDSATTTEEYSCNDEGDLDDIVETEEVSGGSGGSGGSGSGGTRVKKSVTFSEKVSRATFKSTALIGVLRTRKRKPKKKEKKARRSESGGDLSSSSEADGLEKQGSVDSQEDVWEETSELPPAASVASEARSEVLSEVYLNQLRQEEDVSQCERAAGENGADELQCGVKAASSFDSAENDGDTDPWDEITHDRRENGSKKSKKKNKKRKKGKREAVAEKVDGVSKDVPTALSWNGDGVNGGDTCGNQRTKSAVTLRNKLVYALDN